jgi:hypothetical protein
LWYVSPSDISSKQVPLFFDPILRCATIIATRNKYVLQPPLYDFFYFWELIIKSAHWFSTKDWAESLTDEPTRKYRDDKMNCSLKLWADIGNPNFFELHIHEDESDDWPYPHEMSYVVKGIMPPSLYGTATIQEFTYQTIVEDEWIPFRSKDTFSVKPSEAVTVPTVASESLFTTHILVPIDFLYLNFESDLDGNLVVKWRRFHRKWTRDREGRDILCPDGLEQIIGFKNVSHGETRRADTCTIL